MPQARFSVLNVIQPLATLLLLLMTHVLTAADRPNIVWIVSEDNSAYYIGCYGNEQAQTPNIDQLAEEGNRYLHAYSNAPVCAVTRSGLLTGVYAVTQGTLHMRSRHPIPIQFRPYVSHLREAGYYCTNADKTDYNFLTDDQAYWDECAPNAHYKNRKNGQPFFSIFNFNSSHEHSIFPNRLQEYRDQGVVPQTSRIHPNQIELPPLYPDTPEIRQDIANYYDAITRMDKQVGAVIDELKARGEADNTIVFYYSDHGGVLPRSKRYVYDSGTRVPLVVHFPDKWKHLQPAKPGETVNENVSFIDFAPTLLSLVGLEKPDYMMGRAFLGDKKEPSSSPYIFLYGDRFDEYYKFNRAITDGRFRYVRNMLPHQSAALRNEYPFQMNAWHSYKAAWIANQTTVAQARLWQSTQPVEELFDTENDPWELNNLATDPNYQELLQKMRTACVEQMVQAVDLGFIPEAMFEELAPAKPVYFYANSEKFNIRAIIDIAMKAGDKNSDHIPLFTQTLTSDNPVERYWAIMGLIILGEDARPALAQAMPSLHDPYVANRIRAAQLLYGLGEKDPARAQLLSDLAQYSSDAVLTLALNVVSEIGENDCLPRTWLKDIAQRLKVTEYSARLANAVLTEAEK